MSAPIGCICWVVDEARYYIATPTGWEPIEPDGDLFQPSVVYATHPDPKEHR